MQGRLVPAAALGAALLAIGFLAKRSTAPHADRGAAAAIGPAVGSSRSSAATALAETNAAPLPDVPPPDVPPPDVPTSDARTSDVLTSGTRMADTRTWAGHDAVVRTSVVPPADVRQPVVRQPDVRLRGTAAPTAAVPTDRSPASPPAAAGSTSAADPADAGERVDVVALLIDGARVGDERVLVAAADRWVPVATLCARRLCRVGTTRVRDGVAYASLAALAPRVASVMDEETGELRLATTPAAFDDTVVSLATAAPANLEYASAPAAYLDYALIASAPLAAHPLAGGAMAATTLEAAATWDTSALAASLTASTAGTHAVRGLASYTLDLPARLESVIAGEAFVAGGVLGGGGALAGLHWRSELALDPYFEAQPSLTYRGTAATPSTVEIYRDGQLVRRDALPPGPFRVEDLTRGVAGDARVVVRDAFGAAQSVGTVAAPPAAALKPGLALFDVALGFAREHLATASFDYGALAALGTYRRGVTPRTTVGLRAEAASDRIASAGASALLSRGHLAVELTAGASVAAATVPNAASAPAPSASPASGEATPATTPPASPTAGGASAAIAANLAWRRGPLVLAAAARTVGARYATIDLAPTADRARLTGELALGYAPLPGLAVNVQLAAERWRDTGDRLRATASAALEVTRVAHLAVSASQLPGDREIYVSLSLSHGARGRTTSTTSAAAGTRGTALSAAVSHPLAGDTGTGAQATVTGGDARSAYASVVGQDRFGRGEASLTWTGSAARLGATASGALVAIGGRVIPARAIHGGFALVRVPGGAGVRAYLENRAIGTTDACGDLVVPDLVPYYANRLRIDAGDLPIDVPLAAARLERAVAVPRAGGAVVAFARTGASTLRGRIVGPAGLDVAYGDLVVDDRPPVPIGARGAFEVEDLAAGTHRAVVHVDGTTCSFPLVATGATRILDLGAVPCAR